MNNLLLWGTATALAGEAFFSGSEIALLNANPAQVYRKARQGDWRAERLKSYYKAPEYWLAATLLGTNLCVVAGAFAAETWASQGPRWLPPVTGIMLILAVLICGEILPKYLIRPMATRWILGVTPVLLFPRLVASPLGWVLSLFTRSVRRTAGKGGAAGHWASREDLIGVISSHLESADKLRALAAGALKHLHRPVSEVMIPISQTAQLPIPSSSKIWRERLKRSPGMVVRIVDREGDTLAVSDTVALLGLSPEGALPNRWPAAPLRVSGRTLLADALTAMAKVKKRWALVELDGKAVGYLSPEDLARRLAS
jgi:putative hemolysin